MRRRERKSIDFDQWPEIDQKHWRQAFMPVGFLTPSGKAAHWRPATVRQVQKGYALWLGFLVAKDLLDVGAEPWSHVTEDNLRAYIEELQARNLASTSIASRITDLREAIRIMQDGTAVMRGELTLALLSRTVGRLRRVEVPRRNKAARVMHPLRILEAALSFLNEIDRLPCPNELIRSTWYRDALILAWLATRPIRLRNVAGIRLNEHLTKVGDEYICRFPADETKEHRILEFPLPAILTPYLDRYIEVHRGRLLGGHESLDLWITVRCGGMTAQTVYLNVCKMSQRLLGTAINPHLLRDCTVSWFATDDPEHLHAAARILGHATLKTTQASYNQAQMLTAVRDLQKVIFNILEEEERP